MVEGLKDCVRHVGVTNPRQQWRDTLENVLRDAGLR